MRGFLHGADALVERGDAAFQGMRRGLSLFADLAEPAGEGFEIAGQRGDLRRGLIGRLGDLIGEPRQALMQRLHRIAQPFAADVALHPFETLGNPDHMRADLIERLRLFARGDVHLHRGLAHHAVAFALAALGGVEAAADAAQLFLDAAIDAGGFRLAARDAVEHLFAVAPRRAALFRTIAAPFFVMGVLRLAHVGEPRQDAPGEPFADRQAFAPRRRACRFACLRRDPRHVPR